MSLSTDEAREMRGAITGAGLDFRTVYQLVGITREVDATPEQVRHVRSIIAEQTGSRPQRLDGRGVESLDVRYDADPEFARHIDSYVAGAPREGDTVRVGSGDYHGHIGIYEGRGEWLLDVYCGLRGPHASLRAAKLLLEEAWVECSAHEEAWMLESEDDRR